MSALVAPYLQSPTACSYATIFEFCYPPGMDTDTSCNPQSGLNSHCTVPIETEMCPTTGLIHVLKQIMQVWTYLTNERHHLISGVSKKG